MAMGKHVLMRLWALPFLVLGLLSASPGYAKDFPSQVIRIVVPFPPGGSVDLVGRILANEMSQYLGESVVVDNRPGAATLLGTRIVSNAEPNGYTVLVTTNSVLINALMVEDAGYKMKDLVPLLGVGGTDISVFVNPAVPAKNVAEFVAYAKSKPIFASTIGESGITLLLWERFKHVTGVKITDVPFRGGAPGLQATVAGDTQAFLQALPTVTPLLQSGKVRAIGVSSETRNPRFPDVPTFKEQGFPTMVGGVWYGAFGPKNLPQPVRDKLREAFAAAMKTTSVQNALEKAGISPFTGSIKDFETLIDRDTKALGEDIARANANASANTGAK